MEALYSDAELAAIVQRSLPTVQAALDTALIEHLTAANAALEAERDARRAALAPFRPLAAAIPSGHADEARLIVTTADWTAGVNDVVGSLTVGQLRAVITEGASDG